MVPGGRYHIDMSEALLDVAEYKNFNQVSF